MRWNTRLRSFTTALGVAAALVAGRATACPEVVVSVDPGDPAFGAAPWAKAAAAWRAGKYPAALQAFRKSSQGLESEVERLFRPGRGGRPPSNVAIQRFLTRTIYARPPALLVVGDRFVAPPPVLWAWADAACRAGAPAEAQTALLKLAAQRDDGAVLRHRLAVGLRLALANPKDADPVALESLLAQLPPEGFFSPYADAVIAHVRGDARAGDRFDAAARAAITPAQRERLAALAAALGRPVP